MLEIKVRRLELEGLDLRLQVRPDGALSIAAAADADAATIDVAGADPPDAEFDGGAGFRTGRDRPDRRDDRRQPSARRVSCQAISKCSTKAGKYVYDVFKEVVCRRPRQPRPRPSRSGQRSAGQTHGLRRFPIVLRAVARGGGVDRRRGEGAAGALERRSAGARRPGADGVADRARSRFRRHAALQRQPAAVRSRHADLAAPRSEARRQFGDRGHAGPLHPGRRLFQARRPRSRAVLHRRGDRRHGLGLGGAPLSFRQSATAVGRDPYLRGRLGVAADPRASRPGSAISSPATRCSRRSGPAKSRSRSEQATFDAHYYAGQGRLVLDRPGGARPDRQRLGDRRNGDGSRRRHAQDQPATRAERGRRRVAAVAELHQRRRARLVHPEHPWRPASCPPR